MSNNPVRKAKMEEANNEYLDTGCPEVAPSCLKCPLPECKHDNQQAYLSWVLDTHRDNIRAPWCKCDQNIAEAAAQRMKDSNIPHRLPGDKPRSFDNFIAREGAAEAYDVAYTFTHKQQGSSILTLVGGTGTGKSHLAEAICRDAVMTGSVRYEYTPHLMDRMRATFNNDSGDSVEDIIAKLTSARVVVLDDLGTEKGSDFTQERLTSIIEQRMARHAKTVITTNLDRKKLEGKGYERLASRLWATGTGEAIVQELTCPDARLYGLPPAPELPF
jgi:DNA replication protein DnaC